VSKAASGPIVVFDGVWKKFRKGERHDSLRDLIPSFARRRPAAGDLESSEDFWALRDVSFEVKHGEALGIIGPNGAGKSTTLKLLTRILKPTRGRCEIRGRAGALIEVAAGFHPDLTGLENIYLQGAIMGMKRAEIKGKLDQIIDFAGVEPFINTPVKRYSSGMNARLGFSIAAHLNPDALIIDEVLSVGDMAFQQKCLDRMMEFRRNGVAIVFVSHHLQSVSQLCDRALYLKSDVKEYGPADQVLQTYVRSLGTQQTSGESFDGTRSAVLLSIADPQLLDNRGRAATTALQPGTPLTLRVSYLPKVDLSDLTFCFQLYRSTDNLSVFDVHYTSDELGLTTLAAGTKQTIDFRFKAHLSRGQYHVVTQVIHNPTQKFLGFLCPAAILTVEEQKTRRGIVDLEMSPSIAGAHVGDLVTVGAGL
jgi:lipopolysaccharide transport system ATP-binding protein